MSHFVERGRRFAQMHDQDGLSYAEIAQIEGLSEHSIRGYASRGRRLDSGLALLEVLDDRETITADLATITRQPDNSASGVALENLAIQGQAQLEARLAQLRRTGRWARFAKLTDFHLPYQDNAAVELTARILEDYQPDLRTAWSDGFEFKSIGRWENNDSVFKRVWDSEPKNFIKAHEKLEKVLCSAAPGALAFVEMGNHDLRMFSHLRASLSIFADFTLNTILEQLISHGIAWLGEDHRDIELSPGLVTLHGRYATLTRSTTAMKHGRDYGFQRSTVAGHVHDFTWYQMRGADYTTYHCTVGCHADLQPPYSPFRQAWQQGISLIDFDPNGYAVSMIPVPYHVIGSNLVAHLFGKEYRAKRTVAAVTLTA